jgi:hypothetical protein
MNDERYIEIKIHYLIRRFITIGFIVQLVSMNQDLLRRLMSQVVSKLKNIDIPEFSYLKKWTFLGILIGIVAGAGSLIFLLAIQFFSYILLGLVGGYYPPLTGGEQMGALDISHLNDPARNISDAFPARPWFIPFITGGGGLIVGFIIYRFARGRRSWNGHCYRCVPPQKRYYSVSCAHSKNNSLYTYDWYRRQWRTGGPNGTYLCRFWFNNSTIFQVECS